MPPSLGKDVVDDYTSIGLSLRPHPMALLRNEPPFNRCSKQNELACIRHRRFVQVAGLVTCRQRPGTAKGTLFLTLEDETGNINVVVWSKTQEAFRKELLTAQLLLVKGTVETSHADADHAVIHVIAGHLQDFSAKLGGLPLQSRDFH